MIKLKDILLESKASEEAKRKGLTHTSFGRYADKSGKIVAMSRNGKLVMLSGDDKKSRIKTMKKANPAKKNPVVKRIYDRFIAMQKASFKPGRTGKLEMPEFIFGGHLPEKTKVVYYEGSMFNYEADQWYRSSRNYQVMDAEARAKVRDLFSLKSNDADRKLGDTLFELKGTDISDARSRPIRIEGRRNSYQQHKNWRSRLPRKADLMLSAILYEWQTTAQYKSRKENPKESQARGRFLNDVIGGKYSEGEPAKIKMVKDELGGAMERGITIREDDLNNFLNNFVVGDVMTLPPCGWSLISTTARQFGSTGGRNFASVLLRVKPKGDSDEMVGLALSDTKKWIRSKYPKGDKYVPSIDQITKEFGSQIEQMGLLNPTIFQSYIKHTAEWVADDVFDWETEVITPGWMGYKVLGITKHIFEQDINTKTPKVYFEIEMEETERVSDELVKEAKVKKTSGLVKILYKYMLGSLHDPKKEKKNGKQNKSTRR